jgi:hypothetical protein
MSMKSVAWISAGVLAVFAVGWLVGGSGKSAFSLERRAATERAGFAEARAAVLDGQVSLYQSNFGDAARQFGAAQATAEALQSALRETGQAERAGRIEIVLSHLREAQRLSTALETGAQDAARQALAALDAAR